MSDVILFDLDNTLLDTKKLLNAYIKPALQEHLVAEPEHFEEVSNRYWQGLTKPTLFDPEEYITHLADSFEAQRSALSNVLYQSNFFMSSLFPDTFETLEKLKPHYRLGIYTEGNIAFQNHKLTLTGIRDFLDPELLFVTNDKVAETYLSQLPDCTIVEDRLGVIEVIAAYPRFQPVWINRESVSQTSDTFCDTIYTLAELPTILGTTLGTT